MGGACRQTVRLHEGMNIKNERICNENRGKEVRNGMKVTVRAAAQGDVPAISEILAESWKTAYVGMVPQPFLDTLDAGRWDHLRNDLEAGTMRAFLLLEDGVPAGTVGYGKSREASFADWGEIVFLYVRPGFCRRGYGKTLLCSAVDALRRAGSRRCYLWALRENRNAREFYTVMGFTETGDVTHAEIGGMPLTDLRYVFSEEQL